MSSMKNLVEKLARKLLQNPEVYDVKLRQLLPTDSVVEQYEVYIFASPTIYEKYIVWKACNGEIMYEPPIKTI